VLAGIDTGFAATGGRAPVFAASAVEGLKRLSPEQRQERRFLQETAAQLRFTTEAAKLAMARSGNAATRELASNLLKYEREAQPDLLRLLHARDMALPMLANDQIKVLKQLGRSSGARFDHLFLQEAGMRAHAYDVRTHERMAQMAQDPALRAWAQQQLPAMRHRLQLAERALPGAERRGAGGRVQPAAGSARAAQRDAAALGAPPAPLIAPNTP
jgi:predicted outer membrane protein